MIVTIIGLGLIGGSIALDLKARGFTNHVIGVDKNPSHTSIALKKGIVQEIADLKTAVQKANLVILAIPVNAVVKLLPQVLDYADENTTVTDMGSTKAKLIESVVSHSKRAQYVAAHPMAGTEYSGPTAAIYNLFDNKMAIICDKENSDAESVTIVEGMFKILKMPILYMDAQEHDIHAAYVSHISHITSFVLAMAVLEKEKSINNIFNLASGGFASTVRLAKSSPQMWSQIFEQNQHNLLEVMDTYIEQFKIWRQCISEGDFEALQDKMEAANAIRKILDR